MSCAGSEVTSLTSHRNDFESGNNQACSESIDPAPCIDFQPDERWHIEEDGDDIKLKLQKTKPDRNEESVVENLDSHNLLQKDVYSEKLTEASDDQNEKSAFGNGKVPVLLKSKPSKEPMKFNGDVEKQYENNISVSPDPEKMPSDVSITPIECPNEKAAIETSKESIFDASENSVHSNSNFSVSNFTSEVESRMGGEICVSEICMPPDGSNQSRNLSRARKDIQNECSSNLSAINCNEKLVVKPFTLDAKPSISVTITEVNTSLVEENVGLVVTTSEKVHKNIRNESLTQEELAKSSSSEVVLSELTLGEAQSQETTGKNAKLHQEELGKDTNVGSVSVLPVKVFHSPVEDRPPTKSSEQIVQPLHNEKAHSEKLKPSIESIGHPVTVREESRCEKMGRGNNINKNSDNQAEKAAHSTASITVICDKDDKSHEVNDDDEDELNEEVKLPCGLDKLVKAGKYVPVKIPQTGNFRLREKEALLECPSLVTPLLLLRQPAELFIPKEKSDRTPRGSRQFCSSKDYLNSTVGKFLIGLGLSRVKEWYHKDMMKVKERQMKREGKTAAAQEELAKHEEAFIESKRANIPFTFPPRRCDLCPFNTESALVMEGHYLTPHVTSRREFRCSYCTFMTRDPTFVMFHYEAMHNKKAILEPPAQFYECPNCPYEVNLKTRANSHISRCQRTFLFSRNQAPVDFDLPGVTAKLVNVADIKQYEVSLAACGRVMWNERERPFHKMPHPPTFRGTMIRPPRQLMPAAKPYTNTMPLYQQLSTLTDSANTNAAIHKHNQQIVPGIQLPSGLVITRPKLPAPPRPSIRPVQTSISLSVSSGSLYQVVNTPGQTLPLPDKKPVNHGTHLTWMPPAESAATQPSSGPQPVALFPNIASGGTENPTIQTTPKAVVSVHQISPGTTQLPRLQGPYPPQGSKSSSPLCNILAGSRFVICEICDGYIKDLDQLRIHMHLIHKVKIHPKMLASRPPLNCQKCQWRFFTDQGLERHLLGAHGLVTSNMQDMANKNQDSGRCTVCGGVYACKLVSHMSQVHKVTLKPAHLSYRCTVCTSTFNLYKLFETHVYTAHSGAMKRSTEDSVQRPAKKPAVSQVASKGLSQTVSVQPSIVCSEEDNYQLRKCKECGMETEEKNMLSHLRENHIKKCFVKLCRIEKCEKCLCSFDGLVVLYTADFGLFDDEEGDND